MSDLIRREDVAKTIQHICDLCGEQEKYDGIMCGSCYLDSFVLDDIPSAEPERKWTAHEVACILAELFGDDCACDYCGLDEWLPEKCDFGTLCQDKDLCGVTCWEQYLKHRGDR